MGKFVEELFVHLLEVAWALFLVFLLLVGIAVIFGRSVGYEITFWVCLGFTMVVAAIFAVIILVNVLCIGFAAIYRRFSNRRW